MAQVTIALAGNPNTGKTSLFNALTGSRQHVGNWPGKTVEKKEGSFRYQGLTCQVVDLPGTYSLSAYSPEEIIARDYLLYERPDVVINVVDASNLERNLYLTVQLLELGLPLVLALNLMDVVRARGLRIDQSKLARLLHHIPIVETVGNKGWGLNQLLAEAIALAKPTQPALSRVA
jgi:ferrous iron transport protein B